MEKVDGGPLCLGMSGFLIISEHPILAKVLLISLTEVVTLVTSFAMRKMSGRNSEKTHGAIEAETYRSRT